MKVSLDFLHKHQFFRMKHTELNEIFWSMCLRSFFLSLTVIFIPIYLYKLGYSANNIMFFYLILYISESLFEYIALNLLVKFGPKHNILFSLPVLVLYFILLLSLPLYQWSLWIIAVVGASSMSLFWQGYHFDFSKAKHSHEVAEEISKLYIFASLLGAAAPFIGGLVASYLGMNILYIITVMGLIVSAMPLFETGEPYVRGNIDFSRINFKKLTRQLISYGGYGVENVASIVIWSFFIFLILESYKNVGFVTSLSLVVAVVALYYVGKKADHEEKIRYIKSGSIMAGITHTAKALASSGFHIVFLNIITSVAHSMFVSTWIAEYYLHADEDGLTEYIFIMELSTDIARVLFFAILYFLSFFLELKQLLAVGLVICGLSIFFIALMPPASIEIIGKSKSA